MCIISVHVFFHDRNIKLLLLNKDNTAGNLTPTMVFVHVDMFPKFEKCIVGYLNWSGQRHLTLNVLNIASDSDQGPVERQKQKLNNKNLYQRLRVRISWPELHRCFICLSRVPQLYVSGVLNHWTTPLIRLFSVSLTYLGLTVKQTVA